MSFLRSSGLPISQMYGYSPAPDNAAETGYVFMGFVEGTPLIDIWFDLEEVDTVFGCIFLFVEYQKFIETSSSSLFVHRCSEGVGSHILRYFPRFTNSVGTVSVLVKY